MVEDQEPLRFAAGLFRSQGRAAAGVLEQHARAPLSGSLVQDLSRVEACDTCQRYVKSVDLTLDARAVPEVDELRSLSLDLWAVEHGYVRLEPGLAGL